MESGIFKVDRPNLAIDGTVTVHMNSGKHYTYKVHTVKNGALEGKRLVSLLTGPDNSRDFKAFAFVVGPHQLLRVWNKCKTPAFMKHAQLLEGEAEEHVKAWLQSGKCAKCGRKLTDPESITAGIGPVCRRIFKNEI